jgi:hypothetical protein
MTEGPIDLIYMDGIETSVVLQISGTTDEAAGSEVLVGEYVVRTPFVQGRLRTTVLADELWEWRDALDGLDAGNDISWGADTRGPELTIERDAEDQRAYVTIKDNSMSLTSVTVCVLMFDSWFDDAYERLDLVMKTWPLARS